MKDILNRYADARLNLHTAAEDLDEARDCAEYVRVNKTLKTDFVAILRQAADNEVAAALSRVNELSRLCEEIVAEAEAIAK